MFIKTLKVKAEAFFNIADPKWTEPATRSADIYHPVNVDDILLNANHIAAAYPVTYKSGMREDAPPRHAAERWLCDVEGTKVILVTGASFVVTARLCELEAAIGTQHPIDVA